MTERQINLNFRREEGEGTEEEEKRYKALNQGGGRGGRAEGIEMQQEQIVRGMLSGTRSGLSK